MKAPLRMILGAGTALVVVLMGGCPNPITGITFTRISDKTPPVVDIASPADNTAYTQTVTVKGTAVDDSGTIKKLAWTVTGAVGVIATGTVDPSTIGGNGSYSFSFSTLSFSGPIGVTVDATDWNDNVGTAVRTLTAPTGALSSFAATTGNKSVTLDWEPVSGATYTVIYTDNGTIPSLTYGHQVTPSAPPYTLTGLANGGMHVFLLSAQVKGTTYWSDYVRAIPLSSSLWHRR